MGNAAPDSWSSVGSSTAVLARHSIAEGTTGGPPNLAGGVLLVVIGSTFT